MPTLFDPISLSLALSLPNRMLMAPLTRGRATREAVPTPLMDDLVERLRDGAPLNTPDPRTFYSAGREGYTDYPRVGEQSAG